MAYWQFPGRVLSKLRAARAGNPIGGKNGNGPITHTDRDYLIFFFGPIAPVMEGGRIVLLCLFGRYRQSGNIEDLVNRREHEYGVEVILWRFQRELRAADVFVDCLYKDLIYKPLGLSVPRVRKACRCRVSAKAS